MTIVRMFGGVDIDLMKPDLTHVSVGSIFRTLSLLLRYNGQTRRPYSVLEHSLLGAERFAQTGQLRQAAAFLLHDAHEAFIGDITTPVAQAAEITDQLAVIKGRLDIAIEVRYNVRLFDYANELREMDQAMFRREWRDLMWNQGMPEPDTDVRRIAEHEPARDALLGKAMIYYERWVR